MSKQDNRIVVDLNKCQYARFYYRNQYGQTVNTLPTKPTVRAMEFDPDAKNFMTEGKTLIEVACEKSLLDRWTPEVVFQVQANHSLTYTGNKALALWKEWNRRIFKRKN
jgi:hypothetical protein